MRRVKIVGEPLENIPWQDRPRDCDEVLWRYANNPIIDWNPIRKASRIFNSAVAPFGKKFVGIFRADHKDGKPQLHLGWSEDALKWDIELEEIHWEDEFGQPYQPNYAYDPRLVKIEGVYYVTWCTDFGGAALGLGQTKDFKEFVRLENPLAPYNRNGVLFPRRVNGKFVLLNRPSDNGHTRFGDIFLSESPDMLYWGKHRRVMTANPGRWWQSVKVGAGPVPIETSEGWLLFYHGVILNCNGFVYSIGAALLDLDHPSKVLYRTRDYLLTPEKTYETAGFVPNVTFPCATLQDPDTGRMVIYYGAADSCVAIAFAQIDELIDHVKANSELAPGDAEEFRG